MRVVLTRGVILCAYDLTGAVCGFNQRPLGYELLRALQVRETWYAPMRKPSRIEAESATAPQLADPGQARGAKRPTGARRTSEEILADLQERLPWLRSGALGGPRRVSLEAYRVNCGRCQRPCTHGPYFRLVLGRHTRGRCQRIYLPREAVEAVATAVRRRQRITAGNKRAIAMLWGHYWQVRLYAPWRWVPAKEWWPTCRLAKQKGVARGQRDHEVPSQAVAGWNNPQPAKSAPSGMSPIEARGAAALEPCVNGNANGRQRRGLVGTAAGTEIGSRLIPCAAPPAFTAR